MPALPAAGWQMLDFQLFRVKVYPSQQGLLFDPPRTPSQVLQETVLSLPAAELRQGATWHIGNVTPLDELGMYFRVGRISHATLEVYQNGAFADQEFETAPYTHVFLDVPLEVCCIAKKSRLAPTAVGVGHQFARLLNRSELLGGCKPSLRFDPINDPQGLIDYLGRATSVQRFWITFKRPNPFDANRDFQQPMQKLLHDAGGAKGKTEVEGQNLNSQTLQDMSRAAAAAGDDAAAVMTVEPQAPKVRKRLRGNPVVLSQDDVEQVEAEAICLDKDARSLSPRARARITMSNLFNFWRWFFRGRGGKAGFRRTRGLLARRPFYRWRARGAVVQRGPADGGKLRPSPAGGCLRGPVVCSGRATPGAHAKPGDQRVGRSSRRRLLRIRLYLSDGHAW